MTCTLRVGRLIAHPCGRGGAAACSRCGAAACERHRKDGICAVCAGTHILPSASIDLADLGDPLEFTPEVFRAFRRRADAPEDELAGVDS